MTLFHPWRESPDELKDADGTFATALSKYMYDVKAFPQEIAVMILQRKVQWEAAEPAPDLESPAGQSTPSSQHQNSQNAAAIAVAEGVGGPDDLEHDFEGDLSQSELDSLPDPPPDYDWSANRKPGAESWLNQYKEACYQARTQRTIQGTEEPLDLFTESNQPQLYQPRNARGHKQKLVIGAVLLQCLRWREWQEQRAEIGPDPLPPDSIFLHTQGNPGAGKTFCGKTMLNVVRSVFNTKRMDKAVAPTGCAASLLNGETSARGIKLPVGKKSKEQPSDAHLPTKTDDLGALHITMGSLFMCLKDEHSMDSRQDWGWTRQRLESTRKFQPKLKAINQGLLSNASVSARERKLAQVQQEAGLEAISGRMFGGIPILPSMGDCHQLPPVGAKSHFDLAPPNADNHGCAAGRIAFSDFVNPPPGSHCRGVTVVMDAVQRQDDPEFKDVLQRMRDGKMERESADYLLQRHFSKLSDEEKDSFTRDAVFLFPTWKRTKDITIKHTKSLGTPIAKLRSKYDYRSTNHAKEDINLPELSALCVGAIVMLLINFVVEEDLKNGTVGKVVDIVYENPEGPRDPQAHPLYCVVDFPTSRIPQEKAWDPQHPTHIPVPLVSLRCEKKCCSQTTVPLRICKAITTYKSQGMTVGRNHVWKKVVVGLNESQDSRKAAGQELVAFSRAEDTSDLAMYDDVEVTRDVLVKIGTGAACNRKRQFEDSLRAVEGERQQWLAREITELDPSTTKTFDGGYSFLCDWFQQFQDAQWSV